MADISFQCPECKQSLEIDAVSAGQQVQCPACCKLVMVPATLPLIAPLIQNPPKRGSAKKTFLIICLICCGIFAFLVILGVVSSKGSKGEFMEGFQRGLGHRSPVVSAPIEIQTATNADERLFLMNLLEHLYSELPANVSNPQTVQATLGELRYEANRHYEDIKQKNLDANQCLAAACLVPSGDIYDNYRVRCLWAAGDIANRASYKEIGHQSWGSAYNETAAQAVQVWKTCLKYSSDPTGECREQMAWVLMCSGNLNEAKNVADSVSSLRNKSSQFAYNMACLESDLKNTETSIQWLEYAIRTLGFCDIAHVKTDPDLDAVRTAQKSRFDEITTVRWTCGIGFGFFNDDVIVTNNSAFWLTHVVFNGTVSANSNSQRIPPLNADQIAPGHAHLWVDAITVRSGSTLTGSLSSDQNR